ncbi:unnamed protein product [Musa banksii]
MTEKAMDKYSVSVNPNAKDGIKKHFTGAMITRGSSIPSTSKEKPLPNYLRAYTNSCHDFCKYGWKEPLKTDTKLPSVLPKLNDNLKKHSTGGMITTGSSLPSTSKKKALPHYLRTCTNSCHKFCKDGWKQAFETDTKPLSVLRKLNNNLEKHSTGGRITTGSSHPSTSKVKPLPRYLRASSNACHDFCKRGRKQVFEAERKHPSFLLKLNNKSKKLSTGGRITTGISLPSTSKVKILPRYLRASTNSCHDFCKYGWKYDFMAETKPLFFPNSINKFTLRDESYQVNKLHVEERNPCAIKLKPSSHRKAKFPDKPAVNKEKFSSKNIKDGFLEFPVKIKLQSPISTQTSSISNDHIVIPILTNEESQVRYTNPRDQKMKQVIKSKNLIKSHSFSYHHKVGEQSTDNGFDARQKTGIIKKRTLSLWEASSSFKPKLVKQTSLKSNITHKIPVPSKITPVSAASKKVSEITTVASRSVLSPSHEPTGRRNGKEVLAKSGEKKDMLEKKMLKPSTASPSLTYIGDGVLSLNHRKHKHGKEVIPDKNQEVGKAQYDSENNEEKTLYVNKRPEKAGLDSTVQKSSKTGNVVCDSSKQPLLKCENSDMDFPLQEMLEPENADTENINLHSFELNLDHQKLIEQTSVDINFPEKKLLNPENSENVIIVKPENADMGILGKNFLELENGNFDSFELDLDDQKLLEQKNADIDFLKQKLMNPENLENVDILKSGNTNMSNVDMDFLEKNLLNPEKIENINMLKPENANMGVLGQKLLELENTNFDCFKLNPDDQKLLEQKNFDLNSLEKKFVNSDDPNNSAYIDLFKPENADMDVLGQNLLELENINLDSFELNPDNKKLFEQKNIDMDLLDDSSELKHDEDWKMVKLKNVDMSFLEQDSLMPEEIDFESLETEPTNQKLLELGKDYMDSPELKLLKPEDINLVDTLELKSDGADVNFLREKLLKLENIDVDALELKPSDDQPSQSATDDVEEIEESESASSETTELDSQNEIKEDNEMDCMDSPELKLLKPEDINLVDTSELKSDDADVNFLQEKLLKLESIDVDALELKPSDDQPSQSATDDVEEIEESESASSETTELDSENEIKEDNDMDCMDSPELKLLKPEDINLVDTLELKSEDADVNFLQEKLLKLENIDVDALELKPSDDQPSESATDDVEEIEESKSASSETTELDSQNEIKQDNEMDCMDSPELKLLKPEDINLVDTLELKSDDADVNFLQEKLLKLENIDVDALELKPSDDQPSQSATDDVEEIEKSESASSETTELDSEHEIKEDNEMDCMDSPELKLLKPEDINLVDILVLKSEDADVNFLQEKLLKLENIDVDALELKPSDDQPSQSATDDVEEIEKSESASSETTELDSEHEIKEDNEMDYMDSPELKLLKPEDINLVDILVLKSEDADVNFLQEKLLKLENIDVDALELKPSDDQPSQSATDDVEEIEKSESASSETTESDSEHEINEDSDNCESLKSEQKRIVRRDAIVHHREDEFSIPHKLKFTRGKAIELQPENNGPKRLRFRRGRMVDRNVNSSHLERENFQRSEMADVVTDSKPETQSIVLKHQDTQEKDVRGLFNNVIEETTNKLVETRKSKVKALIGAFEIVISLQ